MWRYVIGKLREERTLRCNASSWIDIGHASSTLRNRRVRTGLLLLLSRSGPRWLRRCKGISTRLQAAEVEVADVVQKDVPMVSEWTATLDGFVNAQIQPRVAGYLTRQINQEGSYVRKGQVLFEIDARPLWHS